MNDPMFSPCESKCPVTVKRTYIKILSPLFWVFSYRLFKTTEDRKHLQLINTIPSLIWHPRRLLNIVISILISIGSTRINIACTGIYWSFNGHPGEYLPLFTSYNPFVHHLFHSQQEWKQVIVSYRKKNGWVSETKWISPLPLVVCGHWLLIFLFSIFFLWPTFSRSY